MNKEIILILFCVILFFINPVIAEKEYPSDYCPFQKDDEFSFRIWGEWTGDNLGDYGNMSGIHYFKIVSRDETELVMYEEKKESTIGYIDGEPINWYNNPSSYWSFDPKTRNATLINSFAWMWVAPPDLVINTNVTIFNWQFVVTEVFDHLYKGSFRPVARVLYERTRNLTSGGYKMYNISCVYDMGSGHILSYFIGSISINSTGYCYDNTYYTLELIETTVKIEQFNYSITTSTSMPLYWTTIFFSFFIIWKKVCTE